jgi:hypothetical protein
MASNVYVANFNGNNQTGSVTGSTLPALGGALSIECWIYPTAYTSYARIVQFGNAINNSDGISFNLDTSGTLAAFFNPGGTQGFSTNVITLNTWTHVAVTITASGVMTFYRNGQPNGGTTSAPCPTQTRTNQYWGSRSGVDTYFYGSMSELRLWTVARTAAEILQNYNVSLVNEPPELLLNVTSSRLQAASVTGVIVASSSRTITMINYTATTANTALSALLVILLQQYTFNGTLAATGSLALAPVNSSTTLGTPTYVAGPIAGTQALVIPNATSYLVLPYNAALDFSNTFDYSFGGWFYANAGNSQNFVLSNHGTNDYSGYGFEISLSTNGPYGNIWSSTAKYFNGGGPNLVGTWVHLWVVKSANTLTIYYNGTASATTVNLTNFPTASSLGWRINGPRGAIAAGAKVYDVRWYSGVVLPAVAMTPIGATKTYAMSFNGTSQYGRLTSSYFTTGDPFTFECWIYNSHTTMNYDSIVDLSNSTSGTDLMQMYIYPANNIFVASDINGFGTNSSPVPLNGWVHVAATQNTTGLFSLYINGVAAGTSTKNPIAVKARAVVLWGQSYHFLNLFQGYMTELRIWSVARTASQIAANYNVSLSGTETGLQLYVDSNAIKNCPGTGLIVEKTGTYSIQMQNFSTSQITATTALQLGLAPLTVSLTSVDNTSFTTPNGSVTSTVSAGTAPFTYLWSPGGATTSNLTGKSGNTYTVTVTDSTGRSGTASITISDIVLLQQFTFSGTLAATGDLALAPVNSSTTLGTPTYVAGPVAGTQALSLRTADYVEIPYNASLNFSYMQPFSFGCWINCPTSFSNPGELMCNSWDRTGGVSGIEIQFSPGNPNFSCNMIHNSIRPYYMNVIPFTFGAAWHHIWVTYDGSNCRLYGDGTLKLTTAIASGTVFTSTSTWRINGGRDTLFTGSVADVRWYSGVVPPTVAQTPLVSTPTVNVIQFTTAPTSIILSYPAASNALYYKITYAVGTSTVYSTYSAQTGKLTVEISGLIPVTLYSFKVYAMVNGTLSLTASGNTTTPSNTGANYSKAALVIDNPRNIYTILPLQTTDAKLTQTVDAAVNSIFATGDKIATTADIGSSTIPKIASIVTLNSFIKVLQNTNIYIPFSSAVNTAQQASLQLKDNTILPITYSSASDTITVNGMTYSFGQQFVLDGQVVTVCEN